MVEWRVFGCGSPSSCKSTQTSYEIVDGDNRLSIDLGPGGIFRRCQREGSIEKAIDSISHLFLTHCHPDHFFDLARLYVAWMYTPGFKPKNKVSLYATRETLDRVSRVMENTRLEGGMNSVCSTTIVECDTPVSINGFQVTPKNTDHVEGSCGVIIETPSGKTVGFTSDTGFDEQLFTTWKDVNLLVIESSFLELETPYHLHLGQVAQVAGHIHAESILLVHFYPDMENTPVEDIQKRVSQGYNGAVHVAYDGLRLQWDEKETLWKPERMF